MYSPANQPIVLGLPWLQHHNPTNNWNCGGIIFNSANCKACHHPSVPSPDTNQDSLDVSVIPSYYHDLKEVFSKTWATSPPPYLSYDCCIDLLPRTSPPRGKLYSLLAPRPRPCRITYRHHFRQALFVLHPLRQELVSFLLLRRIIRLNSITIKNQ